jgi:hypothetical protein
LEGLTPIQKVIARVADEYLQWYVDRGHHPGIAAIKSLYKVDTISLPFIVNIEIQLFGRTQEQVDPRDPQHSDIITQLHTMDGGNSGILKFNALHQAAYEHRDLREAEGARSSSSNSAAFGR